MGKNGFSEKCYELLLKIPRGKVSTYKEIASALGCKAYRAVGNAMRTNKNAPAVPCHRVIRSNGEIGGYIGGSKKNISKKIKLLKEEGVLVVGGKIELDKYLFRF